MGNGENNIDRLLKARAEIDEELRRHKTPITVVFTDLVGHAQDHSGASRRRFLFR